MLRVIFAGTPDLASTILQALLVAKQYNIVACLTQPDKPAGRGRKLVASPVKQLALTHNIPVYQPENLKTKESLALLQTVAADIMLVVAYGLLVPAQILTLPKYGCLNIHMSLLPRWRGASPIQQAILAGDPETGVTIMQMDAGLDTGDILATKALTIAPSDTSESLQIKMASLGAQALMDVLAELQAGSCLASKQNNAEATYAPKITKQQAKLNWQHCTAVIDQQIRAFNPWPVAFTQIKETIIRIWQSTVPSVQDHTKMAPGTIVAANKAGLLVATGDGLINLQIIQLPGKKAMSIAAVLNANRELFTIGTILG